MDNRWASDAAGARKRVGSSVGKQADRKWMGVSRSGFAIAGEGFEIAGNNGRLGAFCGLPNSEDDILCVPDRRRVGIWATDLHGTGILDGISFDFYPSPPYIRQYIDLHDDVSFPSLPVTDPTEPLDVRLTGRFYSFARFGRVNIPQEYQCPYDAPEPGSFCLWGSGVVTMDVTFVSAGGKRGWAIDQFQYEFLPAPEPATMLPAAFGCTALLLLRRRSRGL